jgi:hypothetical protein
VKSGLLARFWKLLVVVAAGGVAALRRILRGRASPSPYEPRA